MADESPEAAPASTKADVGPDPVWGVCLGALGLVTMAVAGALTKHWWFNAGEALLLLGSAVFLISVAITATKQRPLDLARRFREWREGLDDD